MAFMKIQLTTEQILQILNSQGEDIGLELRSKIVQEFTNKYLKDLVNNTVVQETGELLKKYAEQQIKEQVGTWNGWSSNSIKLEPKIEERICQIVNNFVQDRFNDLVNKAIEERFSVLQKDLDVKISKRVEALTTDYINSRTAEKLKRIQEALEK